MTISITAGANQNMPDNLHGRNLYLDGDCGVVGTMDATALKVGGVTVGGIIATGAVPQGLPLSDARKYDAWKDDLADTAGSGSLGLADTPGSVLKNTASNGAAVDDAAVFLYTLPGWYVAGSAITLRVRAKKDTTAGTVSDTVDVVAKLVGDTLGADICATAEQSITTSYANKDFTITPTGLVPGDILAFEVHGKSDDTGGTTNKQVFISRVEPRLGS